MRDCCQRYADLLARVRAALAEGPSDLLRDLEPFIQEEYDAHVNAAGDASWDD